MRGRTLLVLSVLALLQGGLLLRELSRGEPQSGEERLIRLDRDRVDRIRIQRREGPVVELRRSGERWSVVQPLRDQADPDAVEGVLAASELLERWRGAPAIGAAQLGLVPPVLQLQLAAAGQVQEIRIGAADPSGQGVYVETAPGQRHVVPRAFLEAVDRGLDELRDRSLVRLDRAQLRRVVRSGEGPFTLERQGSSFWIEAGGLRVPAAPEPTDRLLAALLSLRATRFLPGEGGGGTLIRIESGSVVELRLGGECPGRPAEAVVSRREPQGWAARCVDAEELGPLRARVESLQETALTRAEEPALAGVVLRDRGAVLELRRESGLWQLVAGKVPAELDEIRAWLEALRGLRGSLRPLEGAQPAWTGSLELRLEGGGRELLRFGPAEEGQLLVGREGMRGAALLVGGEARSLLAPTPLRFRTRQPWRCSPEEVRALRVDSGEPVELTRRDSGWIVQRPAGASVDGEALQRLLERLCHLRAGRYLERVGVRPERVLSFELDPEALGQSKAPRVGKLEVQSDAQGCVGRAPGMPPFTLEENDCAALRARVLRAP